MNCAQINWLSGRCEIPDNPFYLKWTKAKNATSTASGCKQKHFSSVQKHMWLNDVTCTEALLARILTATGKGQCVLSTHTSSLYFPFLMIYLKSYVNASSDYDLKTFSALCRSLSIRNWHWADWRIFFEIPSYKIMRFQDELFIDTCIRYLFTFIFQKSRSKLIIKQKWQPTRSFHIKIWKLWKFL